MPGPKNNTALGNRSKSTAHTLWCRLTSACAEFVCRHWPTRFHRQIFLRIFKHGRTGYSFLSSAGHFPTDLRAECSLEAATATYVTIRDTGWQLWEESFTFTYEKARFSHKKNSRSAGRRLPKSLLEHPLTYILSFMHPKPSNTIITSVARVMRPVFITVLLVMYYHNLPHSSPLQFEIL
jgi:hypothetical protein